MKSKIAKRTQIRKERKEDRERKKVDSRKI